jgi:Helix-turn-helix domain
VPIGEILAEARQQAGLTVVQVSEQTRIREAVIEGIEGGDYSRCGGDFYARANIRSIAKAVGADPGPLIAEYDALHRARGALSAVSLEELLAMSARAAQLRRPGLPAAGGLVASDEATVRSQAGSPSAREPAVPASRPAGRWLGWAVVLGLLVVIGFGVYSRFSGLRHAAAAPPPAGKHAVTQQPPGPGTPGPAPTATHAAVAPAPVPTATGAALAPALTPALAPAITQAGETPALARAITPAGEAPAPAAAAPAPAPTPATTAAPGTGRGNPPPARRVTGGSRPAGPDHPLARHRPLPGPVPTPGPAPRQAPPSHGHAPRDHHRHRGRGSAGGRPIRPAPSGQAS